MEQELVPPRESVIDFALLLERSLQEEDEWWSGDQVMDLHRLKRELKEQEERLDQALERVRLQGTYLVLTGPQRRAVRSEAVGLVGTCLHILEVCGLLEAEED